jgi:hypothetical protein
LKRTDQVDANLTPCRSIVGLEHQALVMAVNWLAGKDLEQRQHFSRMSL